MKSSNNAHVFWAYLVGICRDTNQQQTVGDYRVQWAQQRKNKSIQEVPPKTGFPKFDVEDLVECSKLLSEAQTELKLREDYFVKLSAALLKEYVRNKEYFSDSTYEYLRKPNEYEGSRSGYTNSQKKQAAELLIVSIEKGVPPFADLMHNKAVTSGRLGEIVAPLKDFFISRQNKPTEIGELIEKSEKLATVASRKTAQEALSEFTNLLQRYIDYKNALSPHDTENFGGYTNAQKKRAAEELLQALKTGQYNWQDICKSKILNSGRLGAIVEPMKQFFPRMVKKFDSSDPSKSYASNLLAFDIDGLGRESDIIIMQVGKALRKENPTNAEVNDIDAAFEKCTLLLKRYIDYKSDLDPNGYEGFSSGYTNSEKKAAAELLFLSLKTGYPLLEDIYANSKLWESGRLSDIVGSFAAHLERFKPALKEDAFGAMIERMKQTDQNSFKNYQYMMVRVPNNDGSHDYYVFDSSKKLGSGGYGAVYKADKVDPASGKIIENASKAIKFFHEEKANKKKIQGTQKSPSIMSALGLKDSQQKQQDEFVKKLQPHHEEVKQMRPYFPDTKLVEDMVNLRAFTVTELLPGQNLRTFLGSDSGKNLTIAQRFFLIQQIAIAANRMGHHTPQSKAIVHTDIKPANIMVRIDDKGRPDAYIIDFGLAKSMQQDDPAELKELQKIGGTKGYDAPEWLSFKIGAKSDVFSLGLVAAEILCAKPPEARRRLSEEIRGIAKEIAYLKENGADQKQIERLERQRAGKIEAFSKFNLTGFWKDLDQSSSENLFLRDVTEKFLENRMAAVYASRADIDEVTHFFSQAARYAKLEELLKANSNGQKELLLNKEEFLLQEKKLLQELQEEESLLLHEKQICEVTMRLMSAGLWNIPVKWVEKEVILEETNGQKSNDAAPSQVDSKQGPQVEPKGKEKAVGPEDKVASYTEKEAISLGEYLLRNPKALGKNALALTGEDEALTKVTSDLLWSDVSNPVARKFLSDVTKAFLENCKSQPNMDAAAMKFFSEANDYAQRDNLISEKNANTSGSLLQKQQMSAIKLQLMSTGLWDAPLSSNSKSQEVEKVVKIKGNAPEKDKMLEAPKEEKPATTLGEYITSYLLRNPSMERGIIDAFGKDGVTATANKALIRVVSAFQALEANHSAHLTDKNALPNLIKKVQNSSQSIADFSRGLFIFFMSTITRLEVKHPFEKEELVAIAAELMVKQREIPGDLYRQMWNNVVDNYAKAEKWLAVQGKEGQASKELTQAANRFIEAKRGVHAPGFAGKYGASAAQQERTETASQATPTSTFGQRL